MLNKRELLNKIQGSLFNCQAALEPFAAGFGKLGRQKATARITAAHQQIIEYVKESMLGIPVKHDYNPAALVLAEGILVSRGARAKCLEAEICPDCAETMVKAAFNEEMNILTCPKCKEEHLVS